MCWSICSRIKAAACSLERTLGLLLNIVVHPADIQDRDGAFHLLRRARRLFPFIKRIFVDGGYAGEKMALVAWRTGTWKLEIVKRPRCPSNRGRGLPMALSPTCRDRAERQVRGLPACLRSSSIRRKGKLNPSVRRATVTPVAHNGVQFSGPPAICCQPRGLVALTSRLQLAAGSICFARRHDARVLYSGRCFVRNSLAG
jgi:hypothetical protein